MSLGLIKDQRPLRRHRTAAKVSTHLHRAGAFETMHLVHDAFAAKVVSRHEEDVLFLRDHVRHLEQARVCRLGCRKCGER